MGAVNREEGATLDSWRQNFNALALSYCYIKKDKFSQVITKDTIENVKNLFTFVSLLFSNGYVSILLLQ